MSLTIRNECKIIISGKEVRDEKEEEYNSMSEALENLKLQTGNTTSKILHDLLIESVKNQK